MLKFPRPAVSHYLLLALLFLVGLELFSLFTNWIIFMAASLMLVMFAGVALVRVEEQGAFRPIQMILPALTAAGLTGFTLFLPKTSGLHAYFVLAALVFYWLLKHGARSAFPTWNWTLTMVVVFIDTAVILGLRAHLYWGMVWILLGIFSVSFLASIQALRRVTSTWWETLLPALALSLCLTEMGWVMQFWSIHFIAQAGIIVAAYYVAFNLLSLSFERRLTKADVTEYGAVGTVGLGILLFTAKWF